jgi:hypothetical protein
MNESKSCFNCRNQNICIHKARIFERLENVLFIVSNPSGLINLIADGIGTKCKYYTPFTPEEMKDRGLNP